MFFDSARRTAAGRAFPAESPPELIDSDVVAIRVLRTRQLECGRDGRAASADDGHFDAFATRHGSVELPRKRRGLRSLCRCSRADGDDDFIVDGSLSKVR